LTKAIEFFLLFCGGTIQLFLVVRPNQSDPLVNPNIAGYEPGSRDGLRGERNGVLTHKQYSCALFPRATSRAARTVLRE
jgi:hypothetical protein